MHGEWPTVFPVAEGGDKKGTARSPPQLYLFPPAVLTERGLDPLTSADDWPITGPSCETPRLGVVYRN